MTVETQVESTAESTETAATTATETTAVEAKTSEKPEVKVKEDWWDTKGLDDKAASRIKAIQTEYNKKATELNDVRTKAQRASELESQMQQLQKSVAEALTDPKKYEEARRDYLKQLGVSVPEEPKEIKKLETVDDLIGMVDSKINQLEVKYNAKLHEKVSEISKPVYEDRWKSALTKVSNKYPQVFEKYQTEVAKQILQGPYKSLYGKMDEVELLEKVFLPLAYNDLIESARQDSVKVIEKKKAAVTQKPSAKITTVSIPAATKEEIIARVRERLGS